MTLWEFFVMLEKATPWILFAGGIGLSITGLWIINKSTKAIAEASGVIQRARIIVSIWEADGNSNLDLLNTMLSEEGEYIQ